MTMNITPMKAITAAVALSVLGVCASWAADEAKEHAELAKALTATTVTLQTGLQASAATGTPISAKFEIDDGKLQLSIYTMKDSKFSEVVINPTNGKVAKSEVITDKGDLDHAAAQKAAMEKAKITLLAVADKAGNGNAGYRLVSVMPELKDGLPQAIVTLARGAEFKTVTEKLD